MDAPATSTSPPSDLEALEAAGASGQEAPHEVQQRLRTLIDYAPDAIVMLDVGSGRFIDANAKAEHLFGLPRERLCGLGPFELSPENQPDGPSCILGREKIEQAVRGEAPVFQWWHRNARGEPFPCEVRLVRMPWGNSEVIRGSIIDISERKQLELCERGRSKLLEEIARGLSLEQVLEDLVRTIENLLPGMLCSVLLLDQDHQCLRLGAAPSLPSFYSDAVEGLRIGPTVGSCGAAAYTGRRVIASDVESHPNWGQYRGLARQAGLRACWSEPVISLNGTILGTFAMYYRESREPVPVETSIIEIAAHLAGIAIEHEFRQRSLRETNETLEQRVAQKTAELNETIEKLRETQADVRLAAIALETHDAVMITDPAGTILRVNESFIRMTGYTPEEAVGQTPRILKSGRHGDDFYQDMWQKIRAAGFWQGEVWNRRKNGQIYPQRLTITRVQDAAGTTTYYVGDGQDLTLEKKAEANRAAIDAARQIQQSLFPTTAPIVPGFEIAGAVCPAEHVSGDYFDFLGLRQDAVGVIVADVSGHGLGPALLMAQTQASLRALAETHDDPGTILTRANQLSQLGVARRFATLFLGRLDPHQRTLVYASAGHQGFHIDRNGEVTTLAATAVPLGIHDNLTVPSSPPLLLHDQDMIVIATDGVSESRNPSGKLFGDSRLLDVVRANRHQAASEIVQLVLDAAREFSATRSQDDDMTVVIVKIQLIS